MVFYTSNCTSGGLKLFGCRIHADLSFNFLITQLSKQRIEISKQKDRDLILSISLGSFVPPCNLLATVLFVKQLESMGYTFRKISAQGTAVNYASRMNFLELLGIVYDEKFSRNPAKSFMELRPIRHQNDVYGAVMDVIKLLKNVLPNVDRAIIGALDHGLYEAIDNVFTHSSSKIGALLTAQTFAQRNEVSVTFGDIGIGIPNRMRQNQLYKSLSDEEALAKALECRETYFKNKKGLKPGEGGQGIGLYHVKRIIETNGGKLQIITNKASLKLDSDGQKFEEPRMWGGTLFHITIKTDVIMDLKSTFNGEIPISIMDRLLPDLW